MLVAKINPTSAASPRIYSWEEIRKAPFGSIFNIHTEPGGTTFFLVGGIQHGTHSIFYLNLSNHSIQLELADGRVWSNCKFILVTDCTLQLTFSS